MTSISKIVNRTPSYGYGILLSLVTNRTLPILVNVHLGRSYYRTDFLTVRMQKILVLLPALKAVTFATLV